MSVSHREQSASHFLSVNGNVRISDNYLVAAESERKRHLVHLRALGFGLPVASASYSYTQRCTVLDNPYTRSGLQTLWGPSLPQGIAKMSLSRHQLQGLELSAIGTRLLKMLWTLSEIDCV